MMENEGPQTEAERTSVDLLAILEWADGQGLPVSILLDQAEAFELSPPEDEEENQQAVRLKALKELIAKDVMATKGQMLAEGDFSRAINRPPSEIEREVLDWFITREALASVPRQVERLLGLRSIQAHIVPSDTVRNYLLDAINCYVVGANRAATVLCRSVLEVAFKDAYERQGITVDHSGLTDLIDKARVVKLRITDRAIGLARRVRDLGNSAVHPKTSKQRQFNDATVLNCLDEAGQVLGELYAN